MSILEDRHQIIQRAIDAAKTDSGQYEAFPGHMEPGHRIFRSEVDDVLVKALRDQEWLGGKDFSQNDKNVEAVLGTHGDGISDTADSASQEEYGKLLEALRRLLYKSADPSLSKVDREEVVKSLKALKGDNWREEVNKINTDGLLATSAVAAVLPTSRTRLEPVMDDVTAPERSAGFWSWERDLKEWQMEDFGDWKIANRETDVAKSSNDFNRLLNLMDRGLAHEGINKKEREKLRDDAIKSHSAMKTAGEKIAFYQRLSTQIRGSFKAVSDQNSKIAMTAAMGTFLNTETARATFLELPETICDPVLSLPFGTITEDVANNVLKKRGEAPLASWHARFMPALMGGDEHYQNGGMPWDHPDRPATGNGKTGLVSPWDELVAVKDTADDYQMAIRKLPAVVSNLVNPTDGDAQLEQQIDKMYNDALAAQTKENTNDPGANPAAMPRTVAGAASVVKPILNRIIAPIVYVLSGIGNFIASLFVARTDKTSPAPATSNITAKPASEVPAPPSVPSRIPVSNKQEKER